MERTLGVGGDWNMAPSKLLDAQWIQQIGGVVVAPSQPTCHVATYDYFVVSRGLAPSIVSAFRVQGAGLWPHWPARLLLRSRRASAMVGSVLLEGSSVSLYMWLCRPWLRS